MVVKSVSPVMLMDGHHNKELGNHPLNAEAEEWVSNRTRAKKF